MKNKTFNLILAVTVMFISAIMTSCGGSKPISRTDVTGFVDIEKNECQKEADKKPALRAYGLGMHFREMTARNIAETQARAQFARAIASAITTSTEENANSNVAYDGDETGANIIVSQNAGVNDFARGVAEAEIKNTTIIMTCPTFNPTTKQYQVSVCIEYNESVAVLASNVTKKVQKLSEERKLKMNFEFEQYRKRIEKTLEKKENL